MILLKQVNFLLLFTLMLFCNGCIKQPGFKNITETDFNGQVVGDWDDTDWTRDKKWSFEENNLFKFETEVAEDSFQVGEILFNPTFPNPFYDQFFVAVRSSSPCIMNMVLVDNMLKVIHTNENKIIHRGNNIIGIAPQGVKTGHYYRLYYTFSGHKSKDFFKGHGDLKKVEY